MPEAACSTVFGLQWGQELTATLYLEEVDALGAQLSPASAALAQLAGAEADAWPALGTPYILALDLGPTGATAFKRYRLSADTSGVRAEFAGTGAVLDLLCDGADGFI